MRCDIDQNTIVFMAEGNFRETEIATKNKLKVVKL